MGSEDARAIIENRIEEIENDQQYQAESANVRVNAPLALVQTRLEGEMSGLKRALDALEEE